jgi:hypothetical protein
MSQRLPALLLGFTVWLAAPQPAAPGSAGGNTIPCEATQQLLFVIDDDGDGVRDPGETTACSNPVVDLSDPAAPVVRNGVAGPVCLPATVASLRGTITLIADDDARDNDLVGQPANTGEVLTMLIEVRHQDQVFRVADAYTAASLSDLKVGNWDNRLISESDIFTLLFAGGLFLTPSVQQGAVVNSGAFDDAGAKLASIAEALGLVTSANDVIPIIADAARDGARKRFIQSDPTLCSDGTTPGCGELEVQENGSLGSVAVFRVTISFAEKLTTAPPTCS